ncbi:hypothetical protein CCACVL1_08195, partial [Corchorus capsularis]
MAERERIGLTVIYVTQLRRRE